MARPPIRTCIGCRTRFPKGELIRLTLSPQGEILPRLGEDLPGRGAYLCPSRACLEAALKGKTLERALRRRVSAPDVAALTTALERQLSQKVLSLLGMARRAGRLSMGWRAAEDALKKEKAALLLILGDAPEGKAKTVRRLAEECGVPSARLEGWEGPAAALGREGVRALALTDKGIAEAILLRLSQRESLLYREKVSQGRKA